MSEPYTYVREGNAIHLRTWYVRTGLGKLIYRDEQLCFNQLSSFQVTDLGGLFVEVQRYVHTLSLFIPLLH